MRQLFAVAVMILTVTVARAETPGGKEAVVKGPHICCGNCEKAVAAILAKVDGISDAKCSKDDKTVTFTAKDVTTATKAWDALYAGGFAGTLKFGDETYTKPSGADKIKVNEVTFDKVHACCGMCVTALKALFPDAKVTVVGKGAQRAVTVTGKDLSPAAVLQALNGMGFNGVQTVPPPVQKAEIKGGELR
jgi:copper chaperone CopZ